MPTIKEKINYDRVLLHNALKQRYKSAAEIAEIIGKSRSWVGSVISLADGEIARASAVPSYSELKLLCALAGLEIEDILLPEEPKSEPVAETPTPAMTAVQPTNPQVIIQQNITITDEQFQWIKDAYQQLRTDARKRHEETQTQIANIGRVLVELLNATKKGQRECVTEASTTPRS